MKKIMIVCLVLAAMCTSVAYGLECIVSVPHFPQQQLNWCSVATAQMWVSRLTCVAPAQSSMAPWYTHPPYWQGMSAYQFEALMENYTSNDFNVNGHSGEKSARERIYKEVREQGRPLAIVGTTARADGTTRPGGHWMLLYGADVAGSNSGYSVTWAQLRDPLYGSAWQSNYRVIYPGERVSGYRLFNTHWKTFSDGTRQSVDD